MALRTCIDGPELTAKARCAFHQAQYEQRRGTAAQRGYDAPWQRTRLRILERDGYRCRVARPGCAGVATSVDHVIPKSRGGTNHDDNLVAACTSCNSGKRDRTEDRDD